MLREIERTREQGTQVFMPQSGETRIQAIRSILTNKAYAKIDGCMIDLFSASAICKVYDALSSVNQSKFAAMPAPKMALIAFKLIK
jgi:hypothetical protein